MTDHRHISVEELAALATGRGGAAVVRRLGDGQLSRNLLLLRYLYRSWPGRPEDRDTALAVLAAVQEKRPEIYAAMLGNPLVGAWTSRLARRLHGGIGTDVPIDPDLGYLGALAAAAASAAGIDAETAGYARNGVVTLPGLGTARFTSPSNGPVRFTIAEGRATVAGADEVIRLGPEAAGGWEPLRRFVARREKLSIEVALEDGDSYRDAFHSPPAFRLVDKEVKGWGEVFADAWDLLCDRMPDRAVELAIGLRVLVPLVDDGTGSARSGTARDSFGMVGLTRPLSDADLLVTLVHEFQHSKLSAALALCPMYWPGGAEVHFAPWREDPRPTAGLIQGVYAFLGVADAWSRLRAHAPVASEAEEQFAVVLEEVRAGHVALSGSAELTEAGRRFTDAMGEAITSLEREPVPTSTARRAKESLRRKRIEWSDRNGIDYKE